MKPADLIKAEPIDTYIQEALTDIDNIAVCWESDYDLADIRLVLEQLAKNIVEQVI